MFALSRDLFLSAVARARAPDGRLAAAGTVPDGVPHVAYPAAPAADSRVGLLAALHSMQHYLQVLERMTAI